MKVKFGHLIIFFVVVIFLNMILQNTEIKTKSVTLPTVGLLDSSARESNLLSLKSFGTNIQTLFAEFIDSTLKNLDTSTGMFIVF